MKQPMRVAAVIAGAIFAAPAAAQQPMHHAPASVSGELGVIHFPTSGSPQAQRHFLRGLLLLHSFEYLAARQSFQTAWQVDPGFAMAAWGEALSYNHPLWAEQDTAAARAALHKLGATATERLSKAPTPRERDYLESVERLYGEGDKAQRDASYSKALESIARRYPQDLDARSLYALSLLGLSNGKRDPANYMRAAAEAESVYEIDRHHPAALHYLIHAYDDPVHAPLGLRAARLYGKVAPAASHAQHMPSHIFFALGMWDEAIAANLGSLKTARATGDAGYHPLLWLEYAYLQKNLRPNAVELLRSVAHDVSAGPSKENRLRLAFARATWLVETRGENDADARLPVDSSGVTYFLYFAVQDFARGITAAAAGDALAARSALAQLRARFNPAVAGPAPVTAAWYDATSDEALVQARALADALDGTIQFYDGQRDVGLARVQAAVDATAHLEFEYGPPWSAKPLDELLGELLLADGRRPAASEAFRRTLVSYPNRRMALEGLAAASAASSATAQDLVGTWRLLSIDVEGPAGHLSDPFYHQVGSGLLIYDPSGWVSVQIATTPRPRLDAPPARPQGSESAADKILKAQLIDTYYAYFGTWAYDPGTSTVTHQVKSALYPGEEGARYAQQVQFDGNRMVFTRIVQSSAGKTIQKKVWERIAPLPHPVQ